MPRKQAPDSQAKLMLATSGQLGATRWVSVSVEYLYLVGSQSQECSSIVSKLSVSGTPLCSLLSVQIQSSSSSIIFLADTKSIIRRLEKG